MHGTPPIVHALRQVARLAAKEWRLLLRNPHGLAVLFLMPAIFVLVMSFTLKNTLIARIDLPKAGWVLEDTGQIAAQWTREWLQRNGGERFASRAQLQAALKARQVEAGVVVRAPLLGEDGRPRPQQLELWLGNLVQPAAAARLRSELTFSLLQVQLKMAAAQAGPFASVLLDSAQPEQLSAQGAPAVRYLYEIESGRTMTAVQQSVPAWLVFGMFFVVIPIAGVLIQERNEGTLARLATMGVHAQAILGGKLLAFMALNWVQLAFMIVVGRWVVPLLGGDALHLDVSAGWFLAMVFATSAAAVGLALLIAARSTSFDHAAALGGGLNVVLGAIAGVMVPRMLMPPGLQRVSEWSPMGWALDGMQSVFLGDPTPALMLPRIGLLLCFALLCLAAAWWPLRHRAGPA
ncbi:ABC transporter permease [Caenimonas aquaedulcis]|uniref:ABC transporter permease n=1 Tax=Caenimonas aquaedulcis TaxID=2793270 RepID=A0A931H4U8_9BURK|nr:ABC transporter permease [Caenimonas aquaedulcis]MBG9388455.1 ABC transporter permease [Caenimonas aquaedulcis]